jgi:predicted ArsR family transcriptional regulator
MDPILSFLRIDPFWFRAQSGSETSWFSRLSGGYSMIEARKGTKWDILEHIRESEEATLENLQDAVELSPSTVNEHLSDLQVWDLLDKRTVRDGPGRPHYVYFLTDQGEELFPHAYAELASMLLDVVRSLVEEPEARDKIEAVMKNRLGGENNLKMTLSQLGFYPETEECDDGTTRMKYHQCPFYEVAKDDPSLCSIDRSVLEDVTGRSVEMESSIAEGAQSCCFLLSEN